MNMLHRSLSPPLRRGRRARRWAIGAMLGAMGLSGLAQAKPTASSTAEERKKVSITVYNQNFGLVREVRDLGSLPAGQVELEFRDVAAAIQPETVHIRSVTSPTGLTVLEQNYRFDLLSPQTLLQKFVGRKIRIYRYHQATGKEEAIDAKLLSVQNGTVLEVNGEVTYDFPGRLAFPEVPPNLIAKPTLVWLVDSQRPKQTVEVTYLTQNLNWNADYVMVVDDQDKKADLTGWVTLVNQSGTSYENAELKLVAGDVQRVAPERMARPRAMKSAAAGVSTGFQEEGLFEYHLYTLQRPATVLDKEQKQVTLLEANGIGIQKKLIFYGQQYWYRGQHGQVLSNQKVGVYLDLENSEKNKMGMPLPKGTIRVYKADKSGAKQFVGEDNIDHTPRDEKIRVKMGEAFDVVGDRKQMKWTALGTCSGESSWEIELRNHKDTAVEVESYEPVGGDWTILSSSHPYQRKDASTFTFTVKVPARGKTKISYVVRIRWC